MWTRTNRSTVRKFKATTNKCKWFKLSRWFDDIKAVQCWYYYVEVLRNSIPHLSPALEQGEYADSLTLESLSNHKILGQNSRCVGPDSQPRTTEISQKHRQFGLRHRRRRCQKGNGANSTEHWTSAVKMLLTSWFSSDVASRRLLVRYKRFRNCRSHLEGLSNLGLLNLSKWGRNVVPKRR